MFPRATRYRRDLARKMGPLRAKWATPKAAATRRDATHVVALRAVEHAARPTEKKDVLLLKNVSVFWTEEKRMSGIGPKRKKAPTTQVRLVHNAHRRPRSPLKA